MYQTATAALALQIFVPDLQAAAGLLAWFGGLPGLLLGFVIIALGYGSGTSVSRRLDQQLSVWGRPIAQKYLIVSARPCVPHAFRSADPPISCRLGCCCCS